MFIQLISQSASKKLVGNSMDVEFFNGNTLNDRDDVCIGSSTKTAIQVPFLIASYQKCWLSPSYTYTIVCIQREACICSIHNPILVSIFSTNASPQTLPHKPSPTHRPTMAKTPKLKNATKRTPSRPSHRLLSSQPTRLPPPS